jgi:hypothetical protein
MSRVVPSILRQAAEPLTSRDIALELLDSRAMDKRDQRLLRVMTKRVGAALRLQRENGGCSGTARRLPHIGDVGGLHDPSQHVRPEAVVEKR